FVVCFLVRVPPVLRSVPTRRSSDLRVPVLTRGCEQEVQGAEADHRDRARLDGGSGCRPEMDAAPHAVGRSGFAGLVAELATVVRDRKSTSLNSSHEWISYAVFCL